MKTICAITGLFLLGAMFVNAQNLCFDEALDVNYAAGNGPQGIAAGDFDEDNNMDVAVINYLEGSTTIFLGSGDGFFASFQTYPGTYPTEIEVADINGDGHEDIITCQNSSAVIVFLAGNGDGTFESPLVSSLDGFTESYRQQFAIADVTGDGELDAIVNDFNTNTVKVLTGYANGYFSQSQTLSTGNQPLDIQVGDFNGDGDRDVACGYAFSESFITVFMNNGSGTLLNGSNVNVGSPFYFYLEVGKFDADNTWDIVVSGATEMYLLTGNGNGTFDAPQISGLAGYAEDLIARDFTGDGELDVVIANESSGLVSCLRGLGTGDFDPLLSSSAKGTPKDLIHGDFDEDGILDLVTANYLSDNISFLKGIGDGSFGSPMLTTNGNPFALASGDINNDGVADIATAESYPSGVSVMIGIGDGTFGETINAIPTYGFEDVAVVDMNGDNFDDVVGMQSSSFVVIAISNGDGTFDPVVNYNAGSGAGGHRQMTVVDIDTDGDMDVLGVYMQDDTFSILFNNGSGVLATEVLYATADLPYDIIADDYDGDGNVDIAVTSYMTNAINYFENNGNDTFAPYVSIAAGLTPVSLVSGDWNGDGDLDLACVNSNSVDISIFIQPDGGGLPTQTVMTTGVNSSPMEITAGDINGDGNVDLAVAVYGQDAVGVYFGNGDGTFEPQVNYPVEQGPFDVVLADFNGDGALDIAASNHLSWNVSVVLNNSAFIFPDGPTTFCEGENVTLSASSGYSFLWSNGETSQSIVVSESGEYNVAITNQSGDCTLITGMISVLVNDNEITVQLDEQFLGPACENEEPYVLYGGSPQGGTYTGTGVVNGVFDPAVGEGTYQITYTYDEPGGCASGSDVGNLVVNPLTDIVFTNAFPDTICVELGVTILEGATPSGGEYSGTGVSDNSIDPAITGQGIFDISYTYMDENGCISLESEAVIVDVCYSIFSHEETLITVMPTLFQDSFVISTLGTFDYVIFNGMGAMVYSGKMNAGIEEIHTMDWAAGTYLVRLRNHSFERLFRLEKVK